MKKNVVVLYGGKSSEHDISLMSALNVVRALDTEKFNLVLIGISRDGVWFLQDSTKIDGRSLVIVEKKENIVALIPGQGMAVAGNNLHVDFVFPILHGNNGEDGTVQGLLDIMDLPYAGSGVLGSSLGMDKAVAKQVWRQVGIPVLDDLIFENNFDIESAVNDIEKKFDYPVFVKPSNAGSSVGTSKASDRESLVQSLSLASDIDSKVLVEPFLRVREVECAVLGGLGRYECYGPGEILPTHEFYDYDAKYNDPNGASLELNANLSDSDLAFIRESAVKAFQSVCADGFSRVDFFVDKDSGKIYLNEINTIPGFTMISMFPKMCEHGGISAKDLVSTIIKLGFDRYYSRKK
ncbi:MAG: D-alanine--D-alanine ligase [Spirochaetales bacterium]|nr:D-alanine--D-alanine ligase [Spirochaetales bacterium]